MARGFVCQTWRIFWFQAENDVGGRDKLARLLEPVRKDCANPNQNLRIKD